ncbi:DinB family protein [Virgibacillus oceani]|uniref:DNA damage-inducible protein DinB n=1 Tax=Virgibacillus oceani TaxID=1479511 RepID=A0A917HEM5_9BACI|nr:DinB family protein [Virgibacillus oceani]GGG76062.1 DNA damage-inducible protein DinB [Virgibacillus oceani]
MSSSLKDYFWKTWEDNRQLTIKVAHRFSDEQLIKATPVPSMRPFARMLLEIAGLEHFFIRGLREDIWEWVPDEATHPEISDAKELFTILDDTRNYTARVWPAISEEQLRTFHTAPPAFAGPDAPPIDWLQYALENEIHHRAQGYTYLRCLGIEPPMFWDRS